MFVPKPKFHRNEGKNGRDNVIPRASQDGFPNHPCQMPWKNACRWMNVSSVENESTKGIKVVLSTPRTAHLLQLQLMEEGVLLWGTENCSSNTVRLKHQLSKLLLLIEILCHLPTCCKADRVAVFPSHKIDRNLTLLLVAHPRRAMLLAVMVRAKLLRQELK